MAAAAAQICLEDIYASLEKASTVAPAEVPRRFVHLDQTLTLARLAVIILTDDIPDVDARHRFVQTLRQAGQRPSCCSPVAAYMIATQFGTGGIRRRCVAFIRQFGWALFSMCAHSLYFSNILQSTQMRPVWDRLCTLIETNAHSIELFGQSRMNWKEPFVYQDYITWAELIYRHLHGVLSGELNFPVGEFFGIDNAQIGLRHGPRRRAGHPHGWTRDQLTNAVSEPTMRYHRHNRLTEIQENQVNISDSRFLNGGRFRWVNRNLWPIDDDPQYRGFDNDVCFDCNTVMNSPNFTPCACTLDGLRRRLNCESTLVELVRYPDRGVGVRALQAFATGDVLGEYLGEQYPCRANNAELEAYPNANCVSYRMEMALQARADPVTNSARALARSRAECREYYIDSAIRGNWTRYMNHSCAAPVRFQNVNLGRKHLLLVIAQRDIKFGAELTADYGPGFWNGVDYACNCGENVCRRWDADRKNNPVSLGQYRGMTAAQRAAYDVAAPGESDASGDNGSSSEESSSDGNSSGSKRPSKTAAKRTIIRLRMPVKGSGVKSSGVKKTPARRRAATTGGRGPACQACNQGHLACGRERPTCAGCRRRSRLCVYPA